MPPSKKLAITYKEMYEILIQDGVILASPLQSEQKAFDRLDILKKDMGRKVKGKRDGKTRMIIVTRKQEVTIENQELMQRYSDDLKFIENILKKAKVEEQRMDAIQIHFRHWLVNITKMEAISEEKEEKLQKIENKIIQLKVDHL